MLPARIDGFGTVQRPKISWNVAGVPRQPALWIIREASQVVTDGRFRPQSMAYHPQLTDRAQSNLLHFIMLSTQAEGSPKLIIVTKPS
jgi:hypothetical protein